jgi:hypothetical protein
VRKAAAIGLSAREVLLTRRSVWRFRGEVMIGIVVALTAWLSPIGPFAGFLMILNWPAAYVIASLINERERGG